MKKSANMKKLNHIARQYVKKMLYYTIYKCIPLINPIEKMVLFESFEGSQYSDNPRAISEELHKLYPDYKIVWHLVNDDKYNIVPDYVTVVKSHAEFAHALATCFCFVKNTHFEDLIKKRKGQYYIQTWHADRPFKKVLYDATKKGNEVTDGKIVDLAISGSVFCTQLYKTAFHYYGKILESGVPRNEHAYKIVNSSTKKVEIKRKLDIPLYCNVLLFAPTFRKDSKEQDIIIDLHDVLDILQNSGDKWVCLVRAHVGAELRNDDSMIRDVSDYPDMADLLGITDLLITDYSSSAADFAWLGGKTLIAAFDQDIYEKSERPFYYTPQEAGFYVASNQTELNKYVSQLMDLDFEYANNKCNSVYGVQEKGIASKKICNIINNQYNKRNKK